MLFDVPDSRVNQEKLKVYDKVFTTYHKLLVRIRDVIHPAVELSAEQIREGVKLCDEFEILLKGPLSVDIEGKILREKFFGKFWARGGGGEWSSENFFLDVIFLRPLIEGQSLEFSKTPKGRI